MIDPGRAWWERVGTADADPLELDGYGEFARVGGQRLLASITDDVRIKLDLHPDHTLLEVGCGAGAITRGLVPHAQSIVAADFSPNMLMRARTLSMVRTRFVAGDAARLPFGNGSFDRVLCYFVFNNFHSFEYARQALFELVRVTKAGGVVLVGQLPNADRRDEWFSAYHARFGGRPRSAVRMALGRARRRLLGSWRALWRHKAMPALEMLYYPPSFVPAALSRTNHRCDMLPAFDLLGNGERHADYRLDARICVNADG